VSAPGAPKLPPSNKGYDISFRDVHFSYRAGAPILRGVNFDIPAGTSCALVGTSGSGKSTLLRLIFRFYDASHGAVTINGRDVKEWDMESVRSPIGAVPQVRCGVHLGVWKQLMRMALRVWILCIQTCQRRPT
jgi:ABC-type transport system involved in Fe-S cluster assembly fused permease/ATPase subunit